jgi:hypothetical protein
MPDFSLDVFSPAAAEILRQHDEGQRLLPLIHRHGVRPPADWRAPDLFPDARHPEAALAGLYLLVSAWNEAHGVAQDLDTPEGSYWHSILHRIEPDYGNAAYWMRRVGAHPIEAELAEAANRLHDQMWPPAWPRLDRWDASRWLTYCERAASRPETPEHRFALHLQREEWRLLFSYCALPPGL